MTFKSNVIQFIIIWKKRDKSIRPNKKKSIQLFVGYQNCKYKKEFQIKYPNCVLADKKCSANEDTDHLLTDTTHYDILKNKLRRLIDLTD